MRNDNSAWLEDLRRKKQEAAEDAQARITELLAERASIDSQLTELGYVDLPVPVPPRVEDEQGRRLRSCSTCRAAGFVDEAKGHIAKGHDQWLIKQPRHIQAHFKGQPAPAHLDPKLVKQSVD